MRPDLRERRIETWELLVCKGVRYSDVTDHISTEWDCSVRTVEGDIAKMDEWLPKIDEHITELGHSRLREMRRNRHRLQEMAEEARANGEHERELDILREIDRNIRDDVNLAQSLGLTNDEPTKQEIELTGTDLTEAEKEQLEWMTSDAGAESTTVEETKARVWGNGSHEK